MPELKPSSSASSSSSRPRAQLSRRPSNLQCVFSAQHLDDASNYHGGDHDSKTWDEDDESEYPDDLERMRKSDDDEAAREGKEEAPEVRVGVLDRQDIEANLEKKQSTRSIKDPNLVRAVDYNLCTMTGWLIGFLGIVG